MRGLTIFLVILSSHALASAPVASEYEAYYLDPPSPPYCTPLYHEPNCFPFGRFRPPLENLPVRVIPIDSGTEFSIESIDISELSKFMPHPRWWEFWKAGWVAPWR